MINLLPDINKRDIRAARHNVLLLRYIGITLLANIALLVVMYGSYTVLTATKTSAEAIIETNGVEADVYNETQEKVTSLTDQLSGAQAIVDQEVKFSHVLTEIAALMPEGTVIKDIELSSNSIGSPTDIVVFSKTTDALLNMQSSFRSSPLFMNVDFQSIGDSDGSVPGYPTSVTMTVLLNKAGING